jgi:tetratricopeptide (TPR) repeat protein
VQSAKVVQIPPRPANAPADPVLAELEERARTAVEMGRAEDAAASLEQLLDYDPENWRVRPPLGACYQRLRRWEDAAREFALCLPLQPDDPDLLASLAVSYMHCGKTQLVHKLLQRALAHDPQHRLAVACRAELALCEQEQDAGAANRSGEALLVEMEGIPVSGPEPVPSAQWTALVQEAESALDQGHNEEAIARAEEALLLRPDAFAPQFVVAYAHHRLSHREAAAAAYQLAMDADPAAWQAPFNLALIEWENGHLEECIRLCERAAALEPRALDPLWRLALAHERAGRPKAAECWLLRVVALDPSRAEAWLRLGLIRLRRGQWRPAAECFERCLAARDTMETAAYHLGLGHLLLGEFEAAQRALEAARAVQPDNRDITLALAIVRLSQNDVERAQALVDDLRSGGTVAAPVSHRLALAWQSAGRHDAALREFRHAVAADPALAPGYFALQSDS